MLFLSVFVTSLCVISTVTEVVLKGGKKRAGPTPKGSLGATSPGLICLAPTVPIKLKCLTTNMKGFAHYK